MRMKWIAASAVAFAVAAPAGMLAPRAHAASPAAAGFYPAFYQDQDRPWDRPPDEYRDVQRQGFHDGIEAARHDWDRHARKDADDHDRYRHPPVSREFHNDYRDGFRHGYDVAMSHIKDERHDRDNDRPY